MFTMPHRVMMSPGLPFLLPFLLTPGVWNFCQGWHCQWAVSWTYITLDFLPFSSITSDW